MINNQRTKIEIEFDETMGENLEKKEKIKKPNV